MTTSQVRRQKVRLGREAMPFSWLALFLSHTCFRCSSSTVISVDEFVGCDLRLPLMAPVDIRYNAATVQYARLVEIRRSYGCSDACAPSSVSILLNRVTVHPINNLHTMTVTWQAHAVAHAQHCKLMALLVRRAVRYPLSFSDDICRHSHIRSVWKAGSVDHLPFLSAKG